MLVLVLVLEGWAFVSHLPSPISRLCYGYCISFRDDAQGLG